MTVAKCSVSAESISRVPFFQSPAFMSARNTAATDSGGADGGGKDGTWAWSGRAATMRQRTASCLIMGTGGCEGDQSTAEFDQPTRARSQLAGPAGYRPIA